MKPELYASCIAAALLAAIPAAAQTRQPPIRIDKEAVEEPVPAPGPLMKEKPGTVEEDPDLPAFLAGKINKAEYLRRRGAHLQRLRGNPEKLGYDARGRALEALRERRQLGLGDTAARTAAALQTTAWTFVGPNPIPNGQTTSRSDAVSGRTIEITVHPTNADIVYVGTAQGGLYRTVNGGTTWTAMLDAGDSLAVNAIAFHPLDPEVLFVGTGESGFSGDSFFGVGLYRISNASSATPTIEGPFGTAEFRGRSISQILTVMSGGNVVVFASTASGGGGADAAPYGVLPSRGIYRCLDGLAATPTFTKLTGIASGGNVPVMDMIFDPADGTGNTLVATVLAASPNGGIWRTTNALAGTPSFTLQQAIASVRIELAVQGGATRTMLAATGEPGTATCGTSGNSGQLRRSTNGGVTWSAAIGSDTNGFCGGQCFYDIAVAVKPDNANVIVLGGSANAANGCSDVLTRSTNGTTFARSDTGLHADTHALAFAPSDPNRVYVGNDGGIWKSTDAGATWTSLNNQTFSATQFQSIAAHATDPNLMIGGTQDNGTELMKTDGTWTRTDYGDGGYARIDQSATGTSSVRMYHTYFNQAGSLMAFATTTSPSAFENWSCYGCGCTGNGISCSDTAVLFYAPMEVGPGTPNTVYYGSDRLYRSANEGVTMTAVSQQFVSGQAVSTIAIAAQNDNVRIVGLENGNVYKTTTGANPMTNVTSGLTITGSPTSLFVTDAAIDPTVGNPTTAYVAFGGFGWPNPEQHVWKTTSLDAGSPAWTPVWDSTLDVPVNTLVINPYDANVVYAGTDVGVFRSTDAGGSWAEYGTVLPNVAVFDMLYHKDTATLRVATHGRGIWEIQDCPVTLSVASAVPSTGGPGTSVTLTGTGFLNVSQVLFGGVAATFTRTSPTSITATVPDGAGTGSVQVVTACGSASTAFTVPACSGAPTFASGTGLAVSTSGCALGLTWNAATPACGSGVTYSVYRSTTGGFTPGPSNEVATGLTTTSWADAAVTPSTTYHYIVRARDNGTGVQETNTTSASATAAATGPVDTAVLNDDFDGSPTPVGHGFGVTTLDGNPPTTWHITNTAPHNGTLAGRFGGAGSTNYSDCQDERLVVGGTGIALPAGATAVELRFWMNHVFEPPTGTQGWDGMRLEYSTNGGSTWNIVPDTDPGAGPFITSNGYHPTAVTVDVTGGACTPTLRSNRPVGSRFWTDTSNGWVEVTANFTRLAGQSVVIGLRGLADQAVNANGVNVDEFRIISTETASCSPSATPAATPALTSRATWDQTSFSGTVTLEWRNPSPGPIGSLRVYRKETSCPTFAGDGTVVYDVDAPAAGSYVSLQDVGRPAGAWCYGLYTFTGAGGTGTASSPLTTTARVDASLDGSSGKASWVYNTGATSLSAPGMFSGAAFLTSNDRHLHGVNPGTAGGDWIGSGSKAWTPSAMNAPSQNRPLVVNMTTHPVMGVTRVAFLGAQDGTVRAVNADTGAELWSFSNAGVTAVQGTATLAARQFGIGFASTDLLLFGTRNPGADNAVWTLNAHTGAAIGTPFDAGGGATGLGIVNGSPLIDYATHTVYVATRERSGGADTLWSLDLTEAGLTKNWSVALGDIDGTPRLSGGRVYVGTNAGVVHALDATTGAPIWSYPTGDGFVKGAVLPDGAGRLYLSTNNAVWALQDNGASASLLWTRAVPGPSPVVRMGTRLLAGGGDGNLHHFGSIATASPVHGTLQVGDGTAIVGSPGFDSTGKVYVGTETGGLYLVNLP